MSTDPYNPDPLAAALANAMAAEARAQAAAQSMAGQSASVAPRSASAADQSTPADAVDPAPSDPQSPEAASARIAELEAELAEMRDRWMRSEAEIQNVRSRGRRDVEETRQYAVQGFARDVAEAAENLKRGLDSFPPAGPGESEIVTRLREGFAGVERSFIGLLERNGIKAADPTGAMFDPNLHQAMSEQETAEHPPGTVLQAWSQGWTLNGRLLRPAMVVVAKAPSAANGNAAASRLDTTA